MLPVRPQSVAPAPRSSVPFRIANCAPSAYRGARLARVGALNRLPRHRSPCHLQVGLDGKVRLEEWRVVRPLFKAVAIGGAHHHIGTQPARVVLDWKVAPHEGAAALP